MHVDRYLGNRFIIKASWWARRYVSEQVSEQSYLSIEFSVTVKLVRSFSGRDVFKRQTWSDHHLSQALESVWTSNWMSEQRAQTKQAVWSKWVSSMSNRLSKRPIVPHVALRLKGRLQISLFHELISLVSEWANKYTNITNKHSSAYGQREKCRTIEWMIGASKRELISGPVPYAIDWFQANFSHDASCFDTFSVFLSSKALIIVLKYCSFSCVCM